MAIKFVPSNLESIVDNSARDAALHCKLDEIILKLKKLELHLEASSELEIDDEEIIE